MSIQDQKHIDHLKELALGNRKAFRVIFESYSGQVYHFSLKYVNNEFEAEEVTQEVFVKLWETRSRIDPKANFSAYLFTIAKNIIFNKHKKRVNEWNYLEKVKNYVKRNTIDTSTVVLYNELETIVMRYIDAMPEKRRKVFVMNRFKGMSHKEIAAEMNISTKTVEVHMRLALKELKEAISRDYNADTAMLMLLMFS